MKFVWAGDRNKENTVLNFTYETDRLFDKIIVCAVDFYQVWVDDTFVSFGPEVTASGYSRKRVINLSLSKKVVVKVTSHNVSEYSCDKQLPFFGVELFNGNEKIAGSTDFTCTYDVSRVHNVPRFSFQRGFVELYDLTQDSNSNISMYEVESPIILEGYKDRSAYEEIPFTFNNSKEFTGFDNVLKNWWEDLRPGTTALKKGLFFDVISKNCKELNYTIPVEKTGFIKLKINAKTNMQIFAVFDEVLNDNEWVFGRSACNDFVGWKVPVGESNVMCIEPYCVKHLKIIYNGEGTIIPSIVCYENNEEFKYKLTGDNKIDKILKAAESSFRQNAVGNFSDCPGRERAGWLCDSYFMGMAEYFFTGNNNIEKFFLENFILSETPEIEEKMLPMCFPSEHTDGNFIPNWAMFFVIELVSYLNRTNDKELINRAKTKVYNIVEYFDDFVNEYGLLENLHKWVFLEWSISSDNEFIKGVNFPTNMLFAKMLESVDYLYGDEKLENRASKIKKTINDLSFNGEFFIDNAIRVDGKLTLCEDHVSETCQYYALFSGVTVSKQFKDKMINVFGPLRNDDVYPQIGRSNVFIGNYLRFFWLYDEGEYARILQESVEYFSKMANETGTLWEKDTPDASCNHGFTSVVAKLIIDCINKLGV